MNFLHEYFHTVQGWLMAGAGGSFALMPAWLQEGSADYWSTHEGVERGIETMVVPNWPNPPQTLDQKRASAAQQVKTTPQPLAAFEERPAGGIQPIAYAFGNIATELLVQSYGRTKAIHDIYSSITSSKGWKQAFMDVFGVSVDQFYGAFEAYRQTL